MELLIMILVLLAFDYVVLRWGADSREGLHSLAWVRRRGSGFFGGTPTRVADRRVRAAQAEAIPGWTPVPTTQLHK